MQINRRPRLIFDIECYHNYFLICFLNVETGNRRYFEMTDTIELDRKYIARIIKEYTLIGFNSENYDIPMLKAALRHGSTNKFLKSVNDYIIGGQKKYWQTEKSFNLPSLPLLDHIDLIEPMPSVFVGLKVYGGRLHSPRLQDLPVDPSKHLTPEQMVGMLEYCWNDLYTTLDCLKHIAQQIELRYEISERIGVDVRSKSDAQIAEVIIKSELTEAGVNVCKIELPPTYSFKYTPPSFIKFNSDQLRDVLNVIVGQTFSLAKTDEKEDIPEGEEGIVKVKVSNIKMPETIKKLKIKIGSTTYKLGIGGLHSTEKNTTHYSDESSVIIDNDVASYYPAIILNNGYYPRHLTKRFIDVYREVRTKRLAAKAIKDKVTDMVYKIVLNGTFGKFGSKYSFLYSPDLMIHTTITGQLSLLMLVERLEAAGISVVSANTDGIVSRCPKGKRLLMLDIVWDWELETGFVMEPCEYKSLHSMSVNSYLAVKPDGSVKQKGIYAFTGSKGSPAEKNPATYVCTDAVIEYLTKGTPLYDTIRACHDIRRFVSVRKVKGGAEYGGEELGKVVRWYYSTQSEGCIKYLSNGNKVPKTDGAIPLMDFGKYVDGGVPSDIDYAWYEREAIAKLEALGVEYEGI